MFLATATNTQNFWAETKGSLFLPAHKGYVMAEMNVICLYDTAHFSFVATVQRLSKKKKKKKKSWHQFSAFSQQTQASEASEREKGRWSPDSHNFRWIQMVRVVLV